MEKLDLKKALNIGMSRRSYFYYKKKLVQNQKTNLKIKTMVKLVSKT